MSAPQVVCRVRPLFAREAGHRTCVDARETEVTLVGGNDGAPPRAFAFDRVFDADASNADVFQTILPTLEDVQRGVNGAVMAYGQSGAGKSHTMNAGGDDPGLIHLVRANRVGVDTAVFFFLYSPRPRPRARALSRRAAPPPPSSPPHDQAVSHLTAFRDAKEAAGEDCHLTFTAFELYNERLLDLTTDSSPDPAGLRVADDPRRGAWPRGAAEIALREGVDASALLRRANARRAVGATGLNPDSSRSHLIVALCLETRDAFSKLFLVDLAGCEKAKRTGAEGSRLDEACGINKSLSALGNVVAALAANSESATNTPEASEASSEVARHVPYRDSKLTRVLREALGGDARATLVTCLSPSVADREESLSTLRFGARARKIAKPPPRRRTKGDGRGPPGRVLQEEALRLRAECLGLRAELDAARRELGELRRNREEEVRDARAVVDRAEAAMAAAVTTEAKAAAKAAGLAAGWPAGSPRRGGGPRVFVGRGAMLALWVGLSVAHALVDVAVRG